MSDINILGIVWALLWILIIGVCVYALRRGGPPERFGAGMILAMAVAGLIVDLVLPENIRGIGHLTNDAILAMAFLSVAIRYASLWLGGAMLLQSVQFSLHAYYFLGKKTPDLLYFIVNDLDTLGILFCLAAGTVAFARKRSRPVLPAPA